MTRTVIKEPWQAAIVARDCVDAMCMFSAIANRLYPEMERGSDREAALRRIPEMARLEALLQAEVDDLDNALKAWRQKQPVQANPAEPQAVVTAQPWAALA